MKIDTFTEAEWEMLIAFIQERTVIPIIGPGLSVVYDTDGGGLIPFETWLIRQLAVRLNCAESPTLDTFVQQYVRSGGNTRSLYPLIRNITIQAPFEPSPALRKLASITDINLWVSTTFDGLLTKALLLERGEAMELAYSPKQFDDLPDGDSHDSSHKVYHLFGKVAAIPRFAICEEDVLEWITALQSETYSPSRLVADLQNHHLLVIGVSYPDWLGRFFVRTAKRRRLSEDREWFEFIVHPQSSIDPGFASFLRNVSRNTYVIDTCGTPDEFVNELHARWLSTASHNLSGLKSTSAPANGPVRFLPPAREMPPDSIFISYSRCDLEAVKRLKASLDDVGLTTWFDLEQLVAGDNYPDKIRRNIMACSYFIPVVSKTALLRDEAFFYREWAWALDRRVGMGPGAIFILPVIIDDLDAGHPRLEPLARTCDIARLPDGVPDVRFIVRLQELLRPSHV